MQPRAKRELLSREEERFVERLLVALGDHLIDEVLAQVPEKYSAGIEKGMGEFRRECQGVPLPTASNASGSHCCAVIRLRESPPPIGCCLAESKPSHQHMVFVEAISDDIGDVTVPGAADGSEAQTVSMQRGTTRVLPFSIARPLVTADKAVLMCDTRQV